MEACCGAHHLGRVLRSQGHTVRLMSPEYVRPYVKAQKNDDRDAEAIAEAARVLVEQARASFFKRKKADREAALSEAQNKEAYHYGRMFHLMSADAHWPVVCPSCGGRAFMAGIQIGEDVSEEESSDYGYETVDKQYVAEEFKCPVCELHLGRQAEIEAVGLEVYHSETEERERRYEEEYNNE